MTLTIQNHDTGCAAPYKTEEIKTKYRLIFNRRTTEKELVLFFSSLDKFFEKRNRLNVRFTVCFISLRGRMLPNQYFTKKKVRKQTTIPMDYACPSDCSFTLCTNSPSNLEQGGSSTDLVTASQNKSRAFANIVTRWRRLTFIVSNGCGSGILKLRRNVTLVTCLTCAHF